MDSLAELWVRSGKTPELLYQGSTNSVAQELRAWVIRRKANNDATVNISWELFRVQDSLRRLATHPEGLSEGRLATSMIQIPALMATNIANLDRERNLGIEKTKETLLASYLLSSLQHRGLRWPQIPHIERTQADAGVCAFLGTLDEGFNAGKEFEILEDDTRIAQWQAELRRRDAIQAREAAHDPIPGVNTHPIGLVGARYRQEISNDPTVSTSQAMRNATHGIMSPELVNFVMRSSFTGTPSTPSTTGEATLATGENATTTDDATVYIADMLGNINIAMGPSPGSVSGTALNTDTAMSSSSSNAAATSNTTNVASAPSPSTPAKSPNNPTVAAIPSSSTAAEIGAKGQDASTKMSKAKKKNEGRKRAKAAQAKQAAEKAETPVGNDDDGHDGAGPDLVYV